MPASKFSLKYLGSIINIGSGVNMTSACVDLARAAVQIMGRLINVTIFLKFALLELLVLSDKR